MTPLAEQWKFLLRLADASKLRGEEDDTRKLLDCAASVKDLWVDAHKELIDGMTGGRNNDFDFGKASISDYRQHVTKHNSVF